MDIGVSCSVGCTFVWNGVVSCQTRKREFKKERKIIMDYGLLGMYIFLALIAIGSFIYVKIEDRKEQKKN